MIYDEVEMRRDIADKLVKFETSTSAKSESLHVSDVNSDKMFECSNTYNVMLSNDDDLEISDNIDPVNDTLETDLKNDSHRGHDFLSTPVNIDGDNDTNSQDNNDSSQLIPESAEEVSLQYQENRKVSFEIPNQRVVLPSRTILPPRMLAREPSWGLLSSEKCVQVCF
jgi:hypothetical protein